MEKYSDLGTDEIHKRHSIFVETIDNKVSRSKVMDQAIIDRYLIQGVITLSQHQSAEVIMANASGSGIYAKTQNWDNQTFGGIPERIPRGIFALGNLLKVIEKNTSALHSSLVEEVVCKNKDVSESEDKMKLLGEGLDAITQHIYAPRKNPMKRFK